MKGNMEKVGEYEKMEEKKNKKIITECLNNVKRNSLKKEKESKINISLKIVIPIVIAILLVTFIVSFILLNYNKQSDNYQLSGSQEYQTTTYSDEYKKTSDLTDADLNDAYQKNYQKSTADDGSYLIKSAEWTDKQKGEGLITIQGAKYQELEETSALYVATMCYAHGLTEDILVRNIQTLIKYYDKVDFIAINNCYAEGILDSKTFTKDATEDEIRLYVSEAKNSGMTYPHLSYSIPYAIQEYLFGNAGDEYINASNLINNPTAIYTSFDSFYLGNTGGTTASSGWGAEYGTEKYFNFIKENFANRYFSMSQYSRQEGKQCIGVRYPFQKYEASRLNVLIGILNPENYGEADLVYSEESLNKWQADNSEDLLELPVEDKKYLADYSYSQDFEATGVQVITNCTIADTVQDYFEIVDVNATGGSASMQTKVMGQNVLVYDENYVCGNEVKITIKVKLRQDETFYFDGFQDTNFGKATLSGKANISVDSPKLATTATYTVNYLEKGTNKELSNSKTYENIPTNTQIKATDEVIDIDGYNYDSADKEILTLGTGENVINLYYTKRTDLSYKVNYLEKDTNKVLSTQKVVNNQTFGTVINSANEIITIEGYDYDSADKTSLTIGTGTNIINLYYTKKDASVLVHHYIDGTETKVPAKNGGEVADETITGKVDDKYSTNASSNIANNYELVTSKLPTNASGTMTEEQIVVTYYYQLKDPTLTSNISKTSTLNKITSKDQEMPYTITYTANVDTYKGDAEVTIVDTLPYTIDEGKSDLAGGTYDSTGKTITWTENISNINSFTGNGTVNVTKTFKVVYVGLDMNQEKITNNVKGHIKLLTPEKTSEEVTGSQESTIYKAIISNEKLADKTEAIEGEKVKYTIRITNDGNLAKTVTVRDTLPAGITFDKDTLIKIGNMDTVYTEQNLKNGIPVEVPAYGSIDVVFAGKVDTLANNEYSKTLKNQATVDNEPTNEVTTNVTKANITAHKEAEPSSGSKVREGDEITYRIKVRNDGTRAGDVIVKDTIPTGTTFVEGSIKIDNIADSSKTATDLANGISITVDISKEVVVEFKVRVNKLIDGTKIKNTAYINQNGEDKKVPEEPEHTYVEPKEEQNISKTGTTTIESLDQEITYNINYTAKITDYSGKATVKLIDTLPYAIDEARSDLAGGTYDAQAQTITWEEPVENIQITEEKEITVNKTIKVVYKDVSPDVVSIKNVVTGHIEYETPVMTSDEVTANATTTTGFTVNIPVSKVWEDNSNKLGQRPTKVVFKLHGSDGSEYIKEMSKPGTQGSTTTQDSSNPNKWNDIFENLPKYDSNNQEIVYTLTEEEKTEGDLKYYDSVVTDKTVTNTNKYGKVIVHHYIMNRDGSTTTTRVPDVNGTEIPDVVIEGKEGDEYTTEEAKNINEKYELVAEKLPANATGKIEKYNEEKLQEVIYYYRLKPAKVLINYLEKDEDTDDSNNLVLTAQEQIDGHVDDSYNTDTDHRKETIEKDGKTYTLVSDSGNKTGNMTLQDITVTYYYLQNTKATVRYVERNPETGEIVKDLEEPTVKEGLVGDEFVTNSKDFVGYKLVESPEKTTIEMTKEEQTLIYYYEPVYTGLIENHIDDKTGKVLYTETHDVQVGEDYDIPSKEFEGYDLVESKLPENAKGTMGEELVTVNYYYIKKAVLEVNYIDKLTGEPLIEQIVDNTKHEGDNYSTEEKVFENYDMIKVDGNKEGTLAVETDEQGNITNNRTIVTYYYAKKSAGVEEHHIDILTGEDIEEPTLHEGHVGDEYDIKAKEFLSYKLVEADEEGNSMLPTNAIGTMTEEKIVVNYYYNQPTKVIVHYVEKATGKEIEETNPETGELQNSQVLIEGQKDDDYTATAKEFEYYTLIEKPQEEQGKMKVEIVKDEEGNDVVNNTIELYYYYEAKPFNIGVDKEITGIIVNGERREPTNGKLEKVEIYRKSTESTSVQVEYKIKVSNTGEVSGNATIEENIPEGMSLANNDGTWEEQEGKLIKVIPELGAGETKEYTVLLNWEQTGENMGEKANEVKLVETGNVPGFVDNNDKDNTSNA
ncbi:MAG: MucBP domain-containing protein, partial [Clostridia bacterium]